MTHEPLTPHRTIAARVRELRKGRGWSAQRLAEEMANVGVPWDRSVVANLENGRRSGVSVQEWLALAYVLSVQPVHLLVPINATDDTPYQLVPKGDPTPALPIRAWIRGQTIIGTVDPRRYFSDVPEVEWQGPASRPWTTDRHRAKGEDDGRSS